jgi:hypothetical protein
MNRKLICAAFALLMLGGLQLANAEVWDAYTDYSSTQSSTSVWQYLDMAGQGTNGPYRTMGTYQDIPLSGYNYLLWDYDGHATNYFGKIVGLVPDLRSDFSTDATNVLAWRSPIDGYVDLTFSVRKQISEDYYDALYALYKDNDSTPMSSGSIAGNMTDGSLNTHTFTNVPVAVGTTFYLHTSPGANIYTDTLGVSFTVTSVPEPGTLVLLSCGFMGLLAFVWGKRK